MNIGNLSSKLLRFVNCKILRDHKLIQEDLWVKGGKIIKPDVELLSEGTINEAISLNGAIIAPGFIDIHLYGGFGIDLTHDYTYNRNAVDTIAKNLLKHGVTAFCPTFVSTSSNKYCQILHNLKSKAGGTHGATILGVHLEGPFINRAVPGNHSAQHITTFTEGVNSLYFTYSNLKPVVVVTLAPELVGSLEAIEALTSKGIIVSMGHTWATMDSAEKAYLKGANMISHLFNAMRPFHHREPGLFGLLTTKYSDKMFYTIVCDGYHIHPIVVKTAYRLNPKGIILTTLATSALGVHNTRRIIHHIGERAFEVMENSAFLAKKKIFSGGTHEIIHCIKSFQKATKCSMAQALEAASLHPAQLLKIDKKKGTLNFGSDADFVVLSERYELISTWIAGEAVYFKK